MNDLEATNRPRRSKAGLYTLVFFRYVVLCAGAIACYCLCYLAYEHNNHHCVDYPWLCTDAQKKNIEVPWAVVLFIWACALSTVESLFSTWHFLQAERRRPDYKRLLITTTPVTLLYLISYWMFYRMPSVKLPCPWGPNNTTRNLKDAPETYDCCIALGVVIAGGIALCFQLLITVMAALAVATSRSKQKKITLAEISSIIAATVSAEKKDGDEEREVLLVI